MTAALIDDLKARGLFNDCTAEAELIEKLESGCQTLYCGFDPTADSLHIGSLVPLLVLKRFQEAGHRPLALVGGATGLIGDPSFKAAERQLNGPDVVAGWVEKLKAQVSAFIDFDAGDKSAKVVNNLDWVGEMNVIEFLRDVGKYFSVNQMIQKESVKQRIEREGSGISFTEFTYMLLQSYDFAKLNETESCVLQIGGSDQWGNITGGTELTRRMHGNQVFGLTLPLVTKADGTKFGKTESGTIWLDPKRTSPYAFFQFWMNTADADVYKFLRYFTFLSIEEIEAIEKADAEVQGRKSAQGILAKEVTRLLHGEEGLAAAERITEALFSGDATQLSEHDLEQIKQDGLPSSDLDTSELADKPLTSILSEAGLGQGKQIKDALGRNAVIVNGQAYGMDDLMNATVIFSKEKAMYGRFFIIKLGKKKHHLFEI
ncbi:tyrosine--tRNA ligase [Bermanella marisrubri]|uniref:Tyrosine--tRNA ligase n=1 Tax=Bermanella marisrubri TaxID=207949 RepID=Q1MXQ2_9GAMM|nr:tyrosine--tRNA ligase [Bermanella marisrubri]EAT10765.1 tyrosyl-tRNA synthetase [Oceanobacter sp. RED65] [Bermanella marisrubri]QIZ83092.1 tyrosine--tRNA ligase [Bermanella marisrubri]